MPVTYTLYNRLIFKITQVVIAKPIKESLGCVAEKYATKNIAN